MIETLKAHAKSILAAIIAVAYTIQAALSDDVVTSAEKVAIAIAFLTAVGVFATPNTPVPPPPPED